MTRAQFFALRIAKGLLIVATLPVWLPLLLIAAAMHALVIDPVVRYLKNIDRDWREREKIAKNEKQKRLAAEALMNIELYRQMRAGEWYVQ